MPMPKDWNVPESMRVRVGERPGRQRVVVEEGHLLLILHRVPQAGVDERVGVYFWRKPDGTWESPAGGDGVAALRSLLDEYDRAIDAQQIALDEAQTAQAYYAVLQESGPLYRAGRNLHQALQAARQQLREITDIVPLRDRGSDIERESELLYADAKHGLDFAVAQQAEAQAEISNDLNRSSHRLNLLAAMFLPVTAVAAVFGMNLRNGLEQADAWLFWIVLGVGLVSGFLVHGAMNTRLPGDERFTRKTRKRKVRHDRVPRDPKDRVSSADQRRA